MPPDTMPTFSSLAKEAFLHRIPGLAEHFVYFNGAYVCAVLVVGGCVGG